MHSCRTTPLLTRLTALIAPLILVTGCASYTCRPSTPPTGSAWGISGTISNAQVRAKKYASFDDPSYPFGKDLNRESLLPVRVMITNHGVGEIKVKTDHIVLADDSTQYTTVNVDTTVSRCTST